MFEALIALVALLALVGLIALFALRHPRGSGDQIKIILLSLDSRLRGDDDLGSLPLCS